jgi:alpha-tubulin suppressor-like RCC1 family protein
MRGSSLARLPRRRRNRTFVLVSAALVAYGVAFLGACAGIVGVEDVTLKRNVLDAGNDDELGPQDDGDIPDSTMPRPQENILEVALGKQHTCARKPDLTVKCWGDDSSGQTGTGGTAADAGILLMPTAVPVTDAIRIAAGQLHTCIVHKTGTVSCWGENQDGQLGDGTSNNRSPVAVAVKNVTGAIGIACGANFSCALLGSGGVSCWGNGLGGQLGTGVAQLQPLAQPVVMLSDAVAISAGESHMCAVKSDGSVVCWGDNFNGQLGTNDKTTRTVPTLISTLDGIALVAAGSRSTCALKNSGAVLCWGANELGQLGSGAANASPNPSPTVVSGLDAKKLWAGKDHACAVRKDSSVACWGAGTNGQIGDGQPRPDASTPTPSPVAVSGIMNAIGIGTGGDHSCAPTIDGFILCWGLNSSGETGNGSNGMPLLSPESVISYP